MANQEDGAYPRLNGSMLNSGQYSGNIISLIGSVDSFDGNTLQFRCADGGVARVLPESPDFTHPSGTVLELIGAANEDNTVSLFVVREMGNDMDLELYNRMLTEVQHNPRYAQNFSG